MIFDKMMWNPIRTIPQTGKQYLVYDPDLKMYETANMPKDHALGKWLKNKRDGKWYGCALPGFFNAEYWTEIENKFNEPQKEESKWKLVLEELKTLSKGGARPQQKSQS